jgi:hypothetical protein
MVMIVAVAVDHHYLYYELDHGQVREMQSELELVKQELEI